MANPLDRDETPARGRSGGLRDIEGIAIESGLPANLLLAVAENAPDADGALGLAREMAAAYSPRIRAGEDIQAILRAEAPDHAEAIIGRARQIGEQIYPEQMRAAREAAEQAAQERRANEPGVLGDFRRAVTAGAVEGIGSVVEGAGILADQPLSLLRDSEVYEPGMLARGGAAVGDAARRMAEGLRGGMSEDSRRAMADSAPDGDLFDPSTWSAGDDPSPRGYLMHFGSTLGSLVPVIATGVAGRVAAVGGRATAMAAGAVGGAQAAGDGAGTAAGLIEEAFQRRGEDGLSELEAASPLFQELRAQGRSEEEAFAAVRDEAARFGAMLQAPIGAVSGAFMGAAARGLNPVINRMPGGPLSRAMRAGLATAFEEGASEAAEGAAARFGAQVASGMDVDLTEGTFGDFVLGAMGGGPVGAIAGAAPGAERHAGGGDDDDRGTGSGVVVSPEPAAPGGSGEGVASTPIAEPAAGRDEQRLARVRVQLRGERQAWDGEIIGEMGDVVQIRAADGQIYEVPRAEIESGDVILTALEGGGPPPARVDTPPPPAADRPGEDFGIGNEPDAEQATAQPMTTDDARRLLDAIEARARRQGWDDEMTAAAAQLKDAIERGTPADPALAQSTVAQIGRSDGSPFPDEASARRALGKLGISAGGYDVVLTEGGYVARPKLDLRDGVAGGDAGTRPLAIDDGGASRRPQIGAEPVIRDGGDDPARQPALPDDRSGVPDAAAPGEPASTLNVQQNEQPLPQGAPAVRTEGGVNQSSVAKVLGNSAPQVEIPLGAPELENASGDVRPAAKSPARQPKVPLANSIRRMGGIAPTRQGADGQRVPTFMAAELRHRGITPRTHPYLFNRNGGADFDNIAPGTFGPDDAQVFGLDDSGSYLDRQAILDRLVDEVTGRGATSLDLEDEAARREAERAVIVQERYADAATAVDGEVERLGLRLLAEEKEAIISAAMGGLPLPDAIYDVIVRSALNTESSDAPAGEGNGADGADAAEIGAVPFGDEPVSERGPDASRRAAGSDAAPQQPSEAGRGREARRQQLQAGGSPDRAVTTDRTDAGDQAVIPGAERAEEQARQQVSDRQRAEIAARQQQSKMRRLGGNEGDAGPLFGTQKDMFAAGAQQPELVAPDAVDRFNDGKANAARIQRLSEAIGGNQFTERNIREGLKARSMDWSRISFQFRVDEGNGRYHFEWFTGDGRFLAKINDTRAPAAVRRGEIDDVLSSYITRTRPQIEQMFASLPDSSRPASATTTADSKRRTTKAQSEPEARDMRAGPVLAAQPVTAAAQETDPSPTLAQAEAENYRTGKAGWNGLTLSVENAKGSTRRGTGPDGTEWSVEMPAHYGRILGTKGADGDHVDFYMGDDETSDFAMIVNQIDPATGYFDEHKVILGARDRAEAMRIYGGGFSDGSGPRRVGSASEHTVDGIKAWLASGDLRKPTRPVRPVNPAPAAAPSSKASEAKPRTTKAQREREAHLDRLAEYFAPGNIVRTYGGGHDRVISFDRGKDGEWTATVQAVSRKGDAWVDAPNERPRTHRTEPEARDMRAGPVGYLGRIGREHSDNVRPQGQAQADAGPQPSTVPAPKAKIEDFGEKIGGAKKDLWSGYAQKLAESENYDLAKEPLSKTWPEPDYEGLIREGADPWSVAFVRAARDAVPRKPSSSWKARQWVEQVRVLRGMARQVLSGDYERAQIDDKMVGSASLQRLRNTISLYETFGHAKSLKGLVFRESKYSVYGGQRFPNGKSIWEITQEQKATAFSNMPRVLAKGDTREEAIDAFRPVHEAMSAAGETKDQAKADRRAKFIIWSLRGETPRTYIVGTKIGANHIPLRNGIADVAEARRIVAEEADQLQAQLDRLRDIPRERRETNEPRVGVDHRNGADVTPEMFQEAFGFRGVEFGNYVEGRRRQEDLNNAYDALMDLAGIIGVPSKALSLNGSLGLAFGARGSGGKNAAAAHFEPGKIVINLTKTQGRGALAHEWFHAVDNYFARQRQPMKGTYITDNATPGGASVPGIRPEVVDAFLGVRSAIAKTKLKERSGRIDKLRSSPYWGTGIEMHARAFESYVVAKLQDQSAANDYLANLVNGQMWGLKAEASGLGDSYPYLKPDEIEAVRPAFDALFRTIETRQTDSGVEMYSRATRGWGEVDADPEPTAEDMKAIARDVTAEMRQHGLDGKINVEVVRDIHQRAYGVYTRTTGSIRVKAAFDLDTVGVLRHEIIHALRDSTLWGREHGLFSKVEWQGLVRAARADKALMERIEASYPDLRTAGKLEEAVAEMYRLWATRRDQRSGVDRAFQKVRAFFTAMANALRGRGLQSAALTMERIASGRIGDRGPEGSAARDAALNRFGDEPAVAESRIAARRPDGRFSSRAAEYSAKLLGGGAITGAAERGIIGQMLTDAMGGRSSRYSILALVPGEPLYQELAKDLGSARTYLRLKHDMSAMRNHMQAEAAKIMDQWRGFLSRNRKANDALMDLMHDATKVGLDPAAPFSTRKRRTRETQAEFDAFVAGRRIEYEALRARWDAMPDRAQEIYRKVRDAYVEVARTERDIIEQNISEAMAINLKRARQAYEDELTRIDEDGLEGDERMEAEEAAAEAYAAVKKRDGYGRASRLRELRQKLESNQVEAPYFPLLRHGQYFVTVKDSEGRLVSFTKAESEREQARIAHEARKEFAEGHEVVTGLMGAQEAAPDVDPLFVADVEKIIGQTINDPALMDAIWQRYLESLPDFSIRKSRLHRKGTPGYARDAFRNFARQMFHSAHQLARLKHGMKMQMALDDAEREAQRADDPNRAMAIVNEMGLRHDWIMNPKTAAWSTWATGAAFIYYLGVTPAAALVNLSQTVIVGIPVLAAAFKKGGALRASRHLMRGLKEFGTGRGAVENAKTLTDDERAAIREAYDRGIVDKSQAHDLAGVAESGVEYSDIRQRVMAPIAFLFHHTERLNREITFIAAYRMARQDGLEHQQAIDKAGQLTWKTHFNYESDSRPRVQQDDFVRVLTVFRNFQLNMLYRLFRDTHQSFKGKTPEERQMARAQLFGITGLMMLSAGVTGTWGYSLMMTLAGMITPGADSDDLEKELRNGLVNMLGADLAGIILKGVPGHLSGIDLTNRLGMPDLWFRSPDRQLEGDDLYTYWAQQFLGAVPGMAQNLFRGVDLAAGGDPWRGVETAAPKFIRDLMRGWRYSQDGVTTISGNTILERVPPLDALTQALGFTPAQISERYEQNRWMMNENVQIQNARSSVLTAVWQDVRDGGPISARTMEQIETFNTDNPDYPIDAATIRRSVQSRRRGATETLGGVRLNNRIEARIRANAPVSIYGAAP